MATLVLTALGDDRPGLVAAISRAINDRGGSWEQSHFSELAGKFAGIVVVGVPTGRVDELTAALGELDGLLEVAAHPGAEAAVVADDAEAQRLTIDLLGNDSPGIVREVSSVLSRHELSIETLTTGTREAPMAGGLLFEAHVVVRVPGGSDSAALRADLERLATELLVDIAVA
jgi:glycine cleavage system regulatory protein